MNTQKQEIDVVQHETKWQAPELVELGDLRCLTQNGPRGHLPDGPFSTS